MDIITSWTCTTVDTVSDCVVTGTTSVSRAVSYYDFLFVNSWILFFLSLMAFGFIFSLLSKKPRSIQSLQ